MSFRSLASQARGKASLMAFSAILACGGFAHADPAGAVKKLVVLRDGSIFQGELIESVPGDHTTLKLATGEVRRFEAADIASEDGHTGTWATPLFLPPPVDSKDYRGADGVKVHVETNKPYATYLFQAAPGGPQIGWNRLCLAPCDITVDPSRTYRIGGERIVDSDSFRFGAKPSQTLYVDATTAGVPTLGWIFLGLGVALTAPSIYLLAKPEGSNDEPGPDGTRIAGWVLLANGVPWLITGIAMVAAGGTTVKSDEGTSIARVPAPQMALGSFGKLTASGFEF